MQALLAVALLASIDLATAQRNLAELDALCAADRGRMWGRSVCGPIVFADPRTRDAVRRNQEGTAEVRVPDSFGIANTAVDWDGVHWTMVMWPLPQNPITRRALLAHESFHRLQKELGLPMSSPANAHLDQLEARVLLRLEWRALARALATSDTHAVEDALSFRAKRRALFPGDDERLLEMNEGLAEYTGYALAVPVIGERVAPLVKKLQSAEKGDAFARSFAYASGAAWGTLLEMKSRRWTRRVKATDDLGELTRRAWGIQASRDPEDYGAAQVRAEEETRAAKKRELLASLRAMFVDGPVLTIPLEKMSFTFDPNRVQPFEDRGSVYESLEVRDVWGKVVAPKGLISSDYSTLIVPVGGYELTATEGWKVIDGVLTNSGR